MGGMLGGSARSNFCKGGARSGVTPLRHETHADECSQTDKHLRTTLLPARCDAGHKKHATRCIGVIHTGTALAPCARGRNSHGADAMPAPTRSLLPDLAAQRAACSRNNRSAASERNTQTYHQILSPSVADCCSAGIRANRNGLRVQARTSATHHTRKPTHFRTPTAQPLTTEPKNK